MRNVCFFNALNYRDSWTI